MGGDTGEHLQEVQCATFAAQQRACRAFEVKQDLVRIDSLTIAHLPMHRNPWIELAKDCIDPGRAGNRRWLTGDDGGLGQSFGGDQLRGDVAAADVFAQRTAHVGFDFGGQVGKT